MNTGRSIGAFDAGVPGFPLSREWRYRDGNIANGPAASGGNYAERA
jgi:hypothetical protein